MSIGSTADVHVIDHMLASGELLPTQLPSASSWSPEKRLAAAVLSSALIAIRDYAGHPAWTERVREDLAWLRSADTASPFSFLRLCELFALDPAWVRECVERWQTTPRGPRTPFSLHRHAA